jgi:CelD/BcsL family acetyltransferase involved in cellulose biosynthesis
LTPEQIGAWSAIQAANPVLESPFFCPEFTMALAQAAENTFVGILQDGAGKSVGFFPFRLVHPGFGRNLEMCDHQGVIAPAGAEYDPIDLIKSCGLQSWQFDHLTVSGQAFRKFHRHTAESQMLDLTLGFEGYRAALSPEGKRHFAKATTSSRKVQREIGPLVLVDDCTDAQVMQAMHRWRAQKYGPLPNWVHVALEQMRTTRTPAFAGVLSALYAGETLLAVHFGIRSRTVLHWCFPAYDPELSSYAPGIQLMLNMAERAPALGIAKIDLGKGEQDYKRRFHNASGTVASGLVEVLSLSMVSRKLCRNGLNYVYDRPGFLRLARGVKRVFRRIGQGLPKKPRSP